MPARPPKTLVAIVAFDGISPFHLSVPCIVFGDAMGGASPFEVVVCASEPAPLRTTANFSLSDLAPLSVLKRADAIVVPSWRDVQERPPERLLKALREAHARGAQIVGLCFGAHVLAEAGLLDGRRATTHWEYAQAMAARFPAVDVDPDVLYVEDGQVLTSAGTAAGIDACLHLIRRRLGAQAANRLARRLVVPPHREGGQAQFIEQPLPDTAGGARLALLIDEVRKRLEQPHTLDSLAAQACMSRRSFTRQFKSLTGSTVQSWLLAERLALSQRLLERTDQSVERVAEMAGFGSVVSLRHHFRQRFGVSPTAWRRSFAAPVHAEA
ncbi:helix-turn-helix domain-containing protein [Paucibacter sp. R3-3]|uniref:Helix-turn-helix domain-containing protein n=1 Tax=Roseateles agri TaxID=3098619 RepID=A0ABU5DKK4_9BURK|nr:helix-turn-helix domain-containing protein [Paucibacter sp. R3-3]MDY0746827.1 helix-turn-helix domain-containing protein [Paucibacter sp. R3-3]